MNGQYFLIKYLSQKLHLLEDLGNLAQYSHRKSKNDNLVLLGEIDEYEPLSRAAYYKALTKEKLQDVDVINPVEIDGNKNNSNA